MSLYAVNIGLFVGAFALIKQTRGFSAQQFRYGLAACVVVAFAFGWAQAQLAKVGGGASGDPVARDFPQTYDKLRQVTLNIGERNTKGASQASVTISEFVDFR
jgi:hypothetical protein